MDSKLENALTHIRERSRPSSARSLISTTVKSKKLPAKKIHLDQEDNVLVVLATTLMKLSNKKTKGENDSVSDLSEEEDEVVNSVVTAKGYSKKPGPFEDCAGYVPKLFKPLWLWAQTMDMIDHITNFYSKR